MRRPLPELAEALGLVGRGDLDGQFSSLYGESEVTAARGRYGELLRRFGDRFGAGPVRIVSTPGRTELGGNHTDHNHGKVLAASIQLDALAACRPRSGPRVELFSEGYDRPFVIDLSELEEREEERGRPEALVRGVAARLAHEDFRLGGFDGYVSSSVLPGSGLSSSASFEVLVGSIFNHLFNDGAIPTTILAITGQFAENAYFGKPCGLMDQIACSFGGVVAIDFRDSGKPAIERVEADFEAADLRLMVVDTGGSHADLTPDYAAIPAEMRSVARELDGEVCRDITLARLLESLPRLRARVGDRALLRALHFLRENERVERQAEALRQGRIDRYLEEVRASGRSSIELLQNAYSPAHSSEQGISLALALTEPFIARRGAARVHGGGFAGTIQAYLPAERADEYAAFMSRLFGSKAVTELRIRSAGSIALL